MATMLAQGGIIAPLIVMASFIILSIIGQIISRKAEKKRAARIVTLHMMPRREEEEEPQREEPEQEKKEAFPLERHHLETELSHEHLKVRLGEPPGAAEQERTVHHDPLAFLNRFPPLLRMVVFHELLMRQGQQARPFFLHRPRARLPFPKREGKEA